MNTLDVVSTGALMLLGLILLVLLIQTLRLRDIWQMMLGYQKAVRWVSIWELENKELRSALRAERACRTAQRKASAFAGIDTSSVKGGIRSDSTGS